MMKNKKKKPFLVKILIFLLSLILLIVIAAGIGCAFLYFKFNINVFAVVGQVQTLNQEIKVDKLVTNAYGEADSTFAQSLIEITDGDCHLKTEQLINLFDNNQVKFSDKQLGAMVSYMLSNQDNIKLNLGQEINLQEYNFQLLQIDLSNIGENTADFNVVVKLDLDKVKEPLNSFPNNLLAKIIPNELYLSSTIKITATADFTYTTASEELLINNLTAKETEKFLATINTFMQFGSANELNKTIGDAFVNLLIGNAEQRGVAYMLYEDGVINEFAFAAMTEVDYLVLSK